MGRHSKITWQDIYKDFRKTYPGQLKNIGRWEPNDFLRIKIYMMDGSIITYSYFDKTITTVQEKTK